MTNFAFLQNNLYQMDNNDVKYSSVFDSTRIDVADNNGDYILSNYDYYILLNSANSDVDSVIMGYRIAEERKKEISYSLNS